MSATKVKERPILFSGPMVRAILAGKKTQTRRVIKPQPPSMESVENLSGSTYGWMRCDDWSKPSEWRVTGPVWAVCDRLGYSQQIRCPYGATGDRLWVRESFCLESFGAGVAQIRYTADGKRGRACGISDRKLPDRIGGVPSIHMPRHASRITLEITDVRVERLYEISEADAEAEGMEFVDGAIGHVGESRRLFCALWDDLNAKRGFPWESNPWVWVVEFVLEQQK